MKNSSGGLVVILWVMCVSSLIEARSRASTSPAWKSCPEGYELSTNPESGLFAFDFLTILLILNGLHSCMQSNLSIYLNEYIRIIFGALVNVE